MNVIEFREVSRRFGKVSALDSVDFSVPAGSVTALIGSNGAGKTTSMKIMNRLINYTGMTRIFETDLSQIPEKSLKSRVFFLPEDKAFPSSLKVKNLASEIRMLSAGIDMEFFGRLLEDFGLTEKWNARARELSLGMQSALYLCVALSSPAELFILDEPLTGLDPILRSQVVRLLKERVLNGDKTVLYSSHILEEVEQSSDGIVILHQGKCLYCGTIDDLKDLFAEAVMENLKSPEDYAKQEGVLFLKKTGVNIWKALIRRDNPPKDMPGRIFPLTLKELFVYLIEREDSRKTV